MFPSPRRGSIFSTLIIFHMPILSERFRPHEGDPSSLLNLYPDENKDVDQFPSPRRGPIFSTMATGIYSEKKDTVSVPTKGTHLLYY